EVVADALGGVAPEQVAVPQPEPVELGAVGGVERCELTVELVGVEQAGLELRDGREQRVGEPTEAGGAAETVQRPPGERAADDQCALRLGRHLTDVAAAPSDLPEQVVERAERAAEQRRLELEQVALD